MSNELPAGCNTNAKAEALTLALTLVENGYRPIPLPYGAKAPKLKGWRHFNATLETMRKHFRGKRNIGLLLADNPMIDIDVRVPEVAEKLASEAERRWPGALKRIGSSPKTGLFVRCEKPFKKLSTSVYQIGGEKCQVEILCDGQQAVAYGRHPDTGRDYEWVGLTPCEIARANLPCVKPEEAQDYITWCEAQLQVLAGSDLEPCNTNSVPTSTTINPLDTNSAKLERTLNQRRAEQKRDEWLKMPDEEKEIERQRVIDMINSTPQNALNYDDWIALGHGIKEVLGEAGFMPWYNFSKKYPKNEYADLDVKWGDLKPDGSVGLGSIVHYLRKAGLSDELISQSAREAAVKKRELRAKDKYTANTEACAPICPKKFDLPDEGSIPRREWLYGCFLIRGFLSLTVAPGGTGKSALSISECLAMVTGQFLMDELVQKRLRVWLWNGEDPYDELKRRFTATCKHFNLSQSDLSDRLMVDSGRDLPIKIAKYNRDGLTVAQPMVEELISAIKTQKIDVLRIDPFATSHQVPENENGPINEVIDVWRRIATEANCAIELIHHVNKSAALNKDQGIYGARGAGALIDGVRAARYLERMSSAEAGQLGLDSHLSYFKVIDGKSNMAPPVTKAVWRKIENIKLANGDCVGVCIPFELPDIGDDVTAEQYQQIQELVANAEFPPRCSEKSAEHWVGNILAEVLDLDIGIGLKADNRSAVQHANRGKARMLLKVMIESGQLVEDQDCKDSRAGRFYTGLRAGPKKIE